MKRLSVLLLGFCLLALVAVPAFAAAPDNVHGLVFIDADEDGVWDADEVGYGGATVTIITPAYDEYVLESAGSRAPDYEGETALCSYQDSVVNDEINESPIRPCAGTWGLPGVTDDVRYEVTITAPEGYVVTSENPQYFTTGSGQSPLDFGIAPLADS